jgi:threonine dehydratase
MAGQALAIADGFPTARIIGIEPAGANDFCQSLAAGKRLRLAHPTSICDGLLTYDVGEHNWPILQRLVSQAITIADTATCTAMRWLYDQHGLRTEPSGAIAVAGLLSGQVDTSGDGDIVVVISGRNVDDDAFTRWIHPPGERSTLPGG